MRLYLSSFRVANKPEELLKLLGGRVRTALILNADDYKSPDDRAASLQREMGELRDIGLRPSEVDLRTYFGRADRLREELAGFDLLYVRGGNAFILRRALRQSGGDEIVKELLAGDAVVYAGYSAGPAMLTPSLRGIELFGDDSSVIPEGYEPAVIWEGLSVLPYALVPHFRSDHPETAGADRAVEYYISHHTPFIALRDGEALVVDGDRTVVVG